MTEKLTELTLETVETIQNEDLKRYHALTYLLTKRYRRVTDRLHGFKDASASKNDMNEIRTNI